MQKALAKEQELLEEWQSKLGKLTDEQKQQIHNAAFSGLNKQHAAEAKKAQSELNKEQQHYKQLIESTPIGEYNAKVADLKNALQKGGIDQQTYNDLMQEAAAKYEKATVGIDKMTKAEKERQRVFEQTSRGKFEKQMDELRAAKPFMSESEYSNKQDKINVDYLKDSGLNPNAKTQIEAATDATKKFDDAIKEMNQSLYETDNTGKMAFDGLLGGISAVAGAFDGMGDALAKHDKHFAVSSEKYEKAMLAEGTTAEQRTELTKAYHSEKEKYETASNSATLSGMRQIMGASSKMFSEQSAARKTFHAIEMALSVVEIAMSIKKTAIKLAEGASTMFAQSGWAGFAGVGLMVAVMAGLGFASSGGSSGKMPEYTKTTGTVLGDSEAQSQSIKTVTDKLDEIHAREFPQLRAIATGMSELKTSISSLMITMFRAGGVKLADANSIGTVNNDKSLQMGALGFAGNIINGIAMGSTVGAAAGVSALVGGIATMGVGLLIQAAAFALSKVPVIGDIINGITNFIGNGLFGKVTQKVVGGGVQIQQQSLGSIMDSGDIDAQVATEIERKKKSWFKTSTKIIEVLSDLDKNISTGIAKVFTNMGSSVLNYWNYVTGGFDKGKIIGGDMEAGLEKLRSFMIPFSNIKTFGLKDEEIQKAFDNYSSMTFDKMVQHVFGGFVAQFQKMGETMAEAMNRIVTEAAQTRTAFRNMGVDFDSNNEHVIIFTQSLANMAGGVKNLTALVDNFTSKFTPNEVKQRISKEDLSSFISDPQNIATLNSQGQGATITAIQNLLNASGNASITAADISALQTGIYESVTALTKSTEKLSTANDSYQTVAATQAADNAFVHENTGATKTEKAWIDYLVAGHAAWKELTTATTTEQARAMATAAGVNADILLNYANGALKNLFAENSKVAADGLAKLASMNLETASKAEFDAQAAAEYAKAQPAQEVLVKALAVANVASDIIKGLSDYTKIVEKTKQLDYTAGKNTDIKRANETAALGTNLEKTANDAYYNRFDQKRYEDDALASARRIFDLQATNAQKSVENLNRSIQKIQEEATLIDTLNGYTQKRIDLLNQEFAATQLNAYDKKIKELKTSLINIGASDATKSANALSQGIQDLRDNFVEVKDAAGNVLNPLQTLIDLLIDNATAKSLENTKQALKAFVSAAQSTVSTIYALANTPADTATYQLQIDSEKLRAESSEIDNLNGLTDKRIALLKLERDATQLSNYKSQFSELTTNLEQIGKTNAEKTLLQLNTKIAELGTRFVEVKDAAGNAINPIQDLITLLRLEYDATNLTAYDAKLGELKASLADISASDSDKIITKLNADIAEIKANFVELSDGLTGVQNPLQTLIDLLIDTQVASSLQKNIETLKGFKTSITDWLDGMKVKEIGNTQAQYEAAQKQFDEKYKIITDTSGAYSNEQKSAAMQGITGAADALVEKIHKYGANGDWAQAEIKALMTKMEGLPETASLEVLTLSEFKTANGYLQTIAENSSLNLQDSQTALQAINDYGKTLTPVLTDAVKTAFSDATQAVETPNETKLTTGYDVLTTSLDSLTQAINDLLMQVQVLAMPPEPKVEPTIEAIKAENSYPAAAPVTIPQPVAMPTPEPIVVNPVDIEPLVLGLSDLSRIANEQLVELRNIYGALSAGMTTQAPANDAVYTPIVEDLPVQQAVQETQPEIVPEQKPFFSNPTTPQESGMTEWFADNPVKQTSSTNSTYNPVAGGATNAQPTTATTTKPFFGSSIDPTPVMHGANTGNGLFRSQEQDDLARTYGKTNQNARNEVDIVSLASQGKYADIAEAVKNASNKDYFSPAEEAVLNNLYNSANSGYLAIGSSLHEAIDAAKRPSLQLFAKGGISNEPAIFGEAGWEAAVPLPDGRTIPVTVSQAPFPEIDFSEVIGVLTEGFGELFERVEELEKVVTSEQRKTTAATKQTGEKIYTAQRARTLN